MLNKINFARDYFKHLKTPVSCLLFKFGLKKEVTVKPKNINKEFKIDKINIINGLMGVLRCQYETNPEFIQFIEELNSDEKVISWSGTKILNFKDISLNLSSLYKFDVITIENILNENNIKSDFLKMDCEGYKFNIILNSDLSDFKDILFEHYAIIVSKIYSLLTNKLECKGFKIKKLDVFNSDFENVGLIHTYK